MTDLPHNYAEKVLQCEVNLEQSPNIARIQALNELYGIGIDYYIDTQPIKARHLQKKMAHLLSRPSILQILQQDADIKQPEIHKNKGNARNLTKRLKTQVVKFHTEADSQIKHLIDSCNETAKKVETLKQQSLNRQQTDLNNRLLKRVKSEQKLQKIMSCKFIRSP